jgi:copper homeostasis protein
MPPAPRTRFPAPLLLEIACGSITDACIAATGADRLELCSALELGGLTPSLGTVLEVSDTLTVPFVALVRPRAGNFVCSPVELAVMERDAALLLEAGATGIVFGCLTKSGDVDVAACRRLLEVAGRAETVFHRAFDEARAPFEALESLVDLGVTRILTSGGKKAALEGVGRLRALAERAAGRIEILPGGGIREHNVEAVVRQTGCDQVHLSRR